MPDEEHNQMIGQQVNLQDLLPDYPNADGLLDPIGLESYLKTGNHENIFATAADAQHYMHNLDNLEYHNLRKNGSPYHIAPDGSGIIGGLPG